MTFSEPIADGVLLCWLWQMSSNVMCEPMVKRMVREQSSSACRVSHSNSIGCKSHSPEGHCLKCIRFGICCTISFVAV